MFIMLLFPALSYFHLLRCKYVVPQHLTLEASQPTLFTVASIVQQQDEFYQATSLP